MSNLERRPAETPTGGLATVSPEPTRQLLTPREVPLGGPRAMLVRRTLPHREIRTVGAWCFLDDYGPASGTDPGMVVPPHPHTGLQTVTWLLSGEVLHQDSLGSEQIVRPGSLSLMTAGRGISHAETSTSTSPDLRGVQLWVALPDPSRDTAADFEHHGQLPVLRAGDLTATVLLGPLGDVRSPATTFTPIVGADLSVRNGGGTVPLEAAWEHAVLALTGDVVVDGEPVPQGALAYLGCGRDRLEVRSDGGDARALLLGGEPFEEQLLMWWNFVGRTHDEVAAAREEWMTAVGGADTRFGHVPAYDGPALPAPALPGTRLRPRGRGPHTS
ncbi:MAG TPA: pirin family protein [Actinomycetes bacterium]|nr:pirin family protein [Actinomycetes bacterium]